MTTEDRLKANLNGIEARLADACAAAGRLRSEVRLIAVTKYVEAEIVRELSYLGVAEFGESRPQTLWAKAEALPHLAWHLVGHLQRNKIDRTLPIAKLIHSADSVRLLEAIDAEAGKRGLRAQVLVEAHLSGETTKQGFDAQELEPLGDRLMRLPNVEIRGLMTMAAYGSSPAESRRTFARLRELRDRLRSSWPNGERLTELSMGMSDDFPEAVAEGATLIRVGSALYSGLLERRQPA